MSSWTGAAQHVPIEIKYPDPIILPKRDRVTMLALEDLHRQLLHANNEAVLNEARQPYHIPQLRTLV